MPYKKLLPPIKGGTRSLCSFFKRVFNDRTSPVLSSGSFFVKKSATCFGSRFFYLYNGNILRDTRSRSLSTEITHTSTTSPTETISMG